MVILSVSVFYHYMALAFGLIPFAGQINNTTIGISIYDNVVLLFNFHASEIALSLLIMISYSAFLSCACVRMVCKKRQYVNVVMLCISLSLAMHTSLIITCLL